MKIKDLYIVDCNSSVKIQELYNKWSKCTAYLSTGNCKHPSWNELINYAKENKDEAINFSLEWLNDCRPCWVIYAFINCAIGDPIDHEKTKGYIDPRNEDVLLAYRLYLEMEKSNLQHLTLDEHEA